MSITCRFGLIIYRIVLNLIWWIFILVIGGLQAESPILKAPIINAHAQ